MSKATVIKTIVNGVVILGIAGTAWHLITRFPTATPIGETGSKAASLLSPGARLAIPQVTWTGKRKRAVVLVSTTCRPCLENASFYRDLAAYVLKDPSLGLTVLSPQPVSEVKAWLREQRLKSDSVFQIDPAPLGFLVYPTLLIVDGTGIVTDVELGRITGADREQEVWARLSSPPRGAVLNNTDYVPEVTGDGDLERLVGDAAPQMLDMRDRKEYAAGHRKAAINIPADELPSRAPVELNRSAPLVVLCATGDITKCRSVGTRLRNSGFPHVVLLMPSAG